jgi:hypothetical protein
MKKLLILIPTLIISSMFLISCNKDKDDETGTSVVSVVLTDAPGNYDAVYVDIQAVEVTGAGGVVNLNASPGIYNLLDFTNGNDTLIAVGSITSGMVEQIRLILGSNNSVVIDGVSYPLATPSAMQSGLKLQIHKSFAPGVAYLLLLDFDAHQSIVEQGNGQYSLKPVIRVVDTAISGSITGTIIPDTVNCSITAEANSIAYSTYSMSTGAFLLPGLPQGTYTVTVNPNPPFLPVTINNVNVVNGNVTDIGVVNL